MMLLAGCSDGTDGNVYINPDGDILSKYIIKREEFIKKQAELKNFLGKETVTADGINLELFCNIGTPKDAKKAIPSFCHPSTSS